VIGLYANAAAAVTAGAVVFDGAVYLPTMFGLKQVTLGFYVGGVEESWAPGESHYENFYLKLAESATSLYAFDGVSITLTALLTQYAAP
jgi:hypothetical protein